MSAAERAKIEEAGPEGFLSGLPIPVDPERIERELARMWKPRDAESGPEPGPVTRACLSNLIIDLPGTAACPHARDVLLAVGRRFPSRMIILVRREGPPSGGAGLSAAVTAICHRPAPGAPPVCCELIILESAGNRLDILRGAVLPLLVPDVPVILVLSGAEGMPLAGLLGEVADRIVFDSRRAPPSGLAAVAEALEARPSLVADDLAWRAGAGIRWALSDIFDDPPARSLLLGLRAVEVRHAPLPGASSRGAGGAGAALLAGWLLSRLGWRFEARLETSGGPGAVLAREGRSVRVALRAAGGVPGAAPGDLESIRIESAGSGGEAYLEASRTGDILRIEAATGGSCVIPRTMPLRARADADLLGEALEHTTHQGIFRAAVDLARRFE